MALVALGLAACHSPNPGLKYSCPERYVLAFTHQKFAQFWGHESCIFHLIYRLAGCSKAAPSSGGATPSKGFPSQQGYKFPRIPPADLKAALPHGPDQLHCRSAGNSRVTAAFPSVRVP